MVLYHSDKDMTHGADNSLYCKTHAKSLTEIQEASYMNPYSNMIALGLNKFELRAPLSINCRIKTGHPFLLKFQPQDEGDGKVILPRRWPSLGAEPSTKIWMNGLNPNYNATRSNSGLNLRNCCRNVTARDSLLSFATQYLFCRSLEREHSLQGSSLNCSRFDFVY